ncbi:hypothetical protein P689_1228 [Candidatus Riesia pediculischaeffi PTSU]|uniref:Uncharacterized protein n=1 Tax=Candidatus Riesia pediculischaeffi PTSU TaxID=1401651 RepID=A0A0C1V602_9ENTR|nr:hypothetical protein P689_1228 [Candidatus Riesia pediculischaeffi PTSU]
MIMKVIKKENLKSLMKKKRIKSKICTCKSIKSKGCFLIMVF